jgi:hypothetical protein
MRFLAAFLILLPGSIGFAQTVTIGALPPNPDIIVDAYPGVPVTAIESSTRAVAAATLTYASFSWSRRPCPAAAKIRFFRAVPGRPPSEQSFAERGPFNIDALTQTVSLSPPVDVLPEDRIAIVRLTTCGNPMAQSSIGPGFYAFAGDVNSLTPGIPVEATPYSGTLSVQATNLAPAPPDPAAIVPVIGSTPGAVGGAFFRSAVQLHNPKPMLISGRLIFHPQGSSGTASDPSLFYSLQPGETQSIPDLLPAMNLTGLGSLDVVPDSALPPPLAVVRVFNDAATSGTLGFTEELVSPGDALGPGQRGILIAPSDPLLFRFNIGIRTLSTGAALTITIRTAAGLVRKTVTRTYPPAYMVQTTAAQFVGEAAPSLDSNESVRVEVTGGNAVIYGASYGQVSG